MYHIVPLVSTVSTSRSDTAVFMTGSQFTSLCPR